MVAIFSRHCSDAGQIPYRGGEDVVGVQRSGRTTVEERGARARHCHIAGEIIADKVFNPKQFGVAPLQTGGDDHRGALRHKLQRVGVNLTGDTTADGVGCAVGIQDFQAGIERVLGEASCCTYPFPFHLAAVNR